MSRNAPHTGDSRVNQNAKPLQYLMDDLGALSGDDDDGEGDRAGGPTTATAASGNSNNIGGDFEMIDYEPSQSSPNRDNRRSKESHKSSGQSVTRPSTIATASSSSDGGDRERVLVLTRQLDELQHQNLILVKNMTRLFLTAKKQLAERNNEIRRLEQLVRNSAQPDLIRQLSSSNRGPAPAAQQYNQHNQYNNGGGQQYGTHYQTPYHQPPSYPHPHPNAKRPYYGARPPA